MGIGSDFRSFLNNVQTFQKYDINGMNTKSPDGYLDADEIRQAAVDFLNTRSEIQNGLKAGTLDEKDLKYFSDIFQDIQSYLSPLASKPKSMFTGSANYDYVERFFVSLEDIQAESAAHIFDELDDEYQHRILDKHVTNMPNEYNINPTVLNPSQDKISSPTLAVLDHFASEKSVLAHGFKVVAFGNSKFPEMVIRPYNYSQKPYQDINDHNAWDKLLADAKAGKIDALNICASPSEEDKSAQKDFFQVPEDLCNETKQQEYLNKIVQKYPELKKDFDILREILDLGVPIYIAASNIKGASINSYAFVRGKTGNAPISVGALTSDGKIANATVTSPLVDIYQTVSFPNPNPIQVENQTIFDLNQDNNPDLILLGNTSKNYNGRPLATNASTSFAAPLAAAAFLRSQTKE